MFGFSQKGHASPLSPLSCEDVGKGVREGKKETVPCFGEVKQEHSVCRHLWLGCHDPTDQRQDSMILARQPH
jgi:hypothetical protein